MSQLVLPGWVARNDGGHDLAVPVLIEKEAARGGLGISQGYRRAGEPLGIFDDPLGDRIIAESHQEAFGA